MTVTAGALRELHRVHEQLADLRSRLKRGPNQVQARRRVVETVETQCSEVQDASKQARMTSDRKQLDLKSGETKIEDLKAKLNACSSNREYQALLDQIAAAEMANSVLADEILEGLEQIDALEIKIGEAKEGVAKAQAELEQLEKQVAESTDSIKADVVRLESELTVAEAALPDDFRIDYDRVIRAKGADALTPAEDGVCAACGQRFTANMQNNMALGKTAFCPSCGRLMYLPEDLSPSSTD